MRSSPSLRRCRWAVAETAQEQFSTVRHLTAECPSAWSAAQVPGAFKGAAADDVEGMMATLVVSGQAVAFTTPDGPRWQRAG